MKKQNWLSATVFKKGGYLMDIRKVYMRYGEHLKTFGAIKVFQGPPTSQLMAESNVLAIKQQQQQKNERALFPNFKSITQTIN